MVTSRTWFERNLHIFISLLCGKQNSCGNKIDYKRQLSAEKAAIQFGAKVNRVFDVYKCWFCRGWHIGGAHNLTFTKFCRIFWFWVIQKRAKI